MGKGPLGPVRRVNVTPFHPPLQCLRRHVSQYDLVNTLHHPVRDGFPHLHSGDLEHGRAKTFNVLNVHRREHVDLVVQQFEDIFVALVMLTSVDVRVRQFIYQRDGRITPQDRVNVHFLEFSPFVLKRDSWNDFETRCELLRRFPAVALNDSNNNIFAATGAPDRFAQHRVGFPHTGGVAEEQLEDAPVFFRSHFLQPLFWCLRHWRNCTLAVQSYNAGVRRNPASEVLKYFAAATIVAVIAFVYKQLPVNPTTVGMTLLVAVLLSSTWWGLRVAIVQSVLATAVFNFLFLPPYGTFTIADPQNWVAVFALLITALVASNLSDRVRREANEAKEHRRIVERLYSLSQQFMTVESVAELLNSTPRFVTESFNADGVALIITSKSTIYKSRPDLDFDLGTLRATAGRSEMSTEGLRVYLPLRLGVRSVGAMVICGSTVRRETADAIGSLVGTALERVRATEELAASRAAHDSEALRSALLDSVTHEFRTPLTSIKASVTGLLASPEQDASVQHELLTVIDEEADRLNRLVGEAAEMAQLDAHLVKLERRSVCIGEVVEAVLEEARSPLGQHKVEVEIPGEIPAVFVDFDRFRQVLTHLVENAAKYSKPGTTIRIFAERKGSFIVISVADQGPGIDSFEQTLIFDKFYRGKRERYAAPGTGMGLAIARILVEAHGGEIGVISQPGSGSVFYFSVPIAS